MIGFKQVEEYIERLKNDLSTMESERGGVREDCDTTLKEFFEEPQTENIGDMQRYMEDYLEFYFRYETLNKEFDQLSELVR